MKVVLDTNVLVSGLLTPFGTCGEIVRMLTSSEIVPCVDSRILLSVTTARTLFAICFEAQAVLLLQSRFQLGHPGGQCPVLFVKRLDFLLGLDPCMSIAKAVVVLVRQEA